MRKYLVSFGLVAGIISLVTTIVLTIAIFLTSAVVWNWMFDYELVMLVLLLGLGVGLMLTLIMVMFDTESFIDFSNELSDDFKRY